ncbi:tetratricopeptide repeat protein [Pediococcus inopinatus]|uniref:tetratricopeptide repeat protein n=1 Tax=Pediococcus inopinatus TaxID=114090 RepID=UPI0007C58CAB|nr:tetratricopeptide repeat protein [Pediococcus inopinatus]
MTEKEDSQRKQAKQNAQEAASALVKAIDSDPDDFHRYYNLGVFLTTSNSFEQAEELYMKALGLFQKNDKAKNLLHYGLGNAYYEAGEFQKAFAQFKVVEDTELKSSAYLMIAQTYMAQDDYKNALVFSLTAQDKHKQDPTINGLIGEIFLAMGDFTHAATYYDEALKADPKNGKYQFERGIIALVLDEDETEYFKQAQKLDPAYFEKGQQRLVDIEKFIQTRNESKDEK